MLIELAWCLPFALLLMLIALLPLVCKTWWEKHYVLICLALSLVVVFYYLGILKEPHKISRAGHEYASFIALIGSLFVVAGGIHISVKGESKPLGNCLFLLMGALIANILGTTGASMVLIRPWIRMNRYRFTAFHLVFFIFIVSNIGGGLTPIGDPPLFLGYLKGVPFFWVVRNVWAEWVLTMAVLMVIFFALDRRNYLRAPRGIREEETARRTWAVSGKRNLFFLAAIVGAVFIERPFFLRETIMIFSAALSYRITPRPVHQQNEFGFGPIREVAILFAGIFVTMGPALDWLEKYAPVLGLRSPGQFFWSSGILSSVLDNAPTYLNFLSLQIGLFTQTHGPQGQAIAEPARVMQIVSGYPDHLRAISVGAVFFGAMTYIGNGPNFLVKAIADHSKVRTPGFFGYMTRYSLPLLLPVFFLVWLVFFR